VPTVDDLNENADQSSNRLAWRKLPKKTGNGWNRNSVTGGGFAWTARDFGIGALAA